jgi:hypothetical protein
MKRVWPFRRRKKALPPWVGVQKNANGYWCLVWDGVFYAFGREGEDIAEDILRAALRGRIDPAAVFIPSVTQR